MVCGTAGQTLVFAQKCLTKKLWQERRFQQSKSPQLYWKNSGTVAIFDIKNLLTKRAKEQRKTLQDFRADKDTKDINKNKQHKNTQ